MTGEQIDAKLATMDINDTWIFALYNYRSCYRTENPQLFTPGGALIAAAIELIENN